jgi:phosphoribosylformimino-5-aminoimidazole carboxamide ribotide isomerase
MRIIPAIDIINGKCVRLSKGDYNTEKIYNHDPVEVAKEFEAHGIQYLHLVDLDGARAKQIINYKVLHAITNNTKLKVDFGGGIKSNEDLKIAFENGASQITGGSIAVTNPELFIEWIQQYGPNKIILGADYNQRKISTQGWLENSDLDVIDFIKTYEAKGIQYVISTDISKDGMLEGTSNELYAEILSKTNIQLIASGGVSKIEDLKILKEIGCEGAIIGKAIYEKRISLKELSKLC